MCFVPVWVFRCNAWLVLVFGVYLDVHVLPRRGEPRVSKPFLLAERVVERRAEARDLRRERARRLDVKGGRVERERGASRRFLVRVVFVRLRGGLVQQVGDLQEFLHGEAADGRGGGQSAVFRRAPRAGIESEGRWAERCAGQSP